MTVTSNGPATIKVSSGLRDRINADARERGVTAAGLIEQLLDDYERRRRMEAFGFAVRGADDEYWDEFREWDVALPAPEGHDGDR
ncbi:toxin-antitoxin system protein [Micrococcus sp. FDAARGOS_333]|uniref:ribbon-helix-helix protein n=1 Tax=Micrococcus sp. FDAARGOS_333 TaxID=1930558 RepID=UPI000B4E25AC|nr:toxin-antitoxin system protein [Micrococcus sp. FDAARGOS_333]PNL17123.1 toxin-antitoxin system protein [Micrococcus sp. FDAARGOS_333]